jgi:zinc protease
MYNAFMKKIQKLSIILSSIFLSALLLTCVATPPAFYQGLGLGTDRIPLTSRALTGVLPNGLRYYILENSLPENRAHLALVVNAGSVLEREEERGLAHFVEHLAFNDTARFPKLELIEYLRSLGMRFGADANAYTSYDETVYHFDVPVENINGVKKIPDRALAILDDWTYTVSFKPEDVASEGLVVLEELRARLGAMDRVRRISLPILFAGSAYENRQPIGLAEIIENATSEQVKNFYSRWYTSDNMALIFVGDFDGKILEAELTRHFNMPAAVSDVNRPRYELPPPKKGNFQIEIITDPELTAASFMIYYKQNKTFSLGTVDSYRETLIDYLIDTMLTERFEEAENDPDSPAVGFWGGIWRWSTSRFYSMGTQPKTGSAEEALKELLLEKESMRRYGFTESELERAKLSLVSYMEKTLSEKDRMESRSYIRGFTAHFLSGEDMADIEWELNTVNLLLSGIGLKEIKQAAENYFSADDCIVFLIAPRAEEKSLPSAEKIRAIFRETEKMRIAPRENAVVSSELLERDPVAGEITAETLDTRENAYILTLANGARVIFKETANRNNEIVLYAIAKGGISNISHDAVVSARLVSEMINVSGLGPYSRTELNNKLAGKQVSFSFWNSNYYRGFQGSSTTQDLNTLFELIHLFFTMPGLDERAISAMIDQYRTTLAHQEEDPQRVFSREINRIIYNNHPLFKPLEVDDMDKVSMDKAANFLSQCINPGDYTFVFTGNIDINKIRELSSIYIASIPNSISMNRWIDPQVIRPQAGERKINKGQDDRGMVYLYWTATGPENFDERKNQVSAVLSEYLDIILTDEIREKLGGVYSISAGASVSVIPKGEYSLSVYFQCNPARVSELIAAVIDRVTEVAADPLNPDTFNKSKEALLMEHDASVQRNLHIAQSYANSSALYNTPLSRLTNRPDVIRAVTPEEVRSLCRDMLVNGPVQVVLYPENW